MATFTDIDTANIAPNKPIPAELMLAIINNIVAFYEGDPSVPDLPDGIVHRDSIVMSSQSLSGGLNSGSGATLTISSFALFPKFTGSGDLVLTFSGTGLRVENTGASYQEYDVDYQRIDNL